MTDSVDGLDATEAPDPGERPTSPDGVTDSGISLSEYHRLTMLIDQLDPSDQFQVIKRAEQYVRSEGVRRFHETTLRYISAEMNGQVSRNSLSYNFRRVYEKNPVLVFFGMAAIFVAVFKFGFALSDTLGYLKLHGFWGDK